MVALQGGDLTVFENPAAFHKPTATDVLKAPTAGFVSAMDSRQIGWAIQRLGAGRANPGDPVSAHAGIEMHVKLGDRVEPGQALLTLFSEDHALLAEPREMLAAAIQIADTAPKLNPLIRQIITEKDVLPDGPADLSLENRAVTS
jgi:pyrimidine-nucleoside phosphorylase